MNTTDTEMTETQKAIAAACDDVKELLLYKNEKYGDSALSHVEYSVNQRL